ncbi:MAG: hypothetical protein AAF922_10650 [Pseudomonadota bacterium]
MAHDRIIARRLHVADTACALFALRSVFALGCAIILWGSLPTFATDQSRDGRAASQTEAFATCAGRFSAVAARHLAQHDPASERAVRFETDFDALVDAVLPIAVEEGVDPRDARHWRIAGWTEMAHLMRLRYSKKDPSRADRAGRAIERRLATCTRMILPG